MEDFDLQNHAVKWSLLYVSNWDLSHGLDEECTLGTRELNTEAYVHASLPLVQSFEAQCGSLSQYEMKHMRSIANMCNAGVKKETMAEVAAQACHSVPANPCSLLRRGFTV